VIFFVLIIDAFFMEEQSTILIRVIATFKVTILTAMK